MRRFTPSISPRAALAGIIMVAMGLAGPGAARAAQDDGAGWSPVSSERLIKLPASYLKKAVDRDYAKSGLAAAMADSETAVGLKHQTLEDLQGAMDRADGALRVDLAHRFLAEKRAYLELVARGQTLRRKRARTKVKLYERLLAKLGYRRNAMTPQRVALVDKQHAALRRLDATSARVDTKFFRSSMGRESRYAAAYAANLSAIERLVQAIGAHPMNDQARTNTAGLSKEDHLRGLIAAAEAELATLGQEASILGFMAKLVSLDAMALSEDVAGADADGNETADTGAGLTKAVDLFVTR
ncbi:MAG: hypothetical protein O7F75_10005 [Alphaproteobacteria bacterium]|nr:hypothetical protein [Alphaproteobacteria bacterium]